MDDDVRGNNKILVFVFGWDRTGRASPAILQSDQHGRQARPRKIFCEIFDTNDVITRDWMDAMDGWMAVAG